MVNNCFMSKKKKDVAFFFLFVLVFIMINIEKEHIKKNHNYTNY